MPNGAKFKYLCTSAGEYGWTSDKKGYRYVKQHPSGVPFPPFPPTVYRILDKLAIEDYDPESCLINWYTEISSLGLHVDNTEECDKPVVSVSLGDSCEFVIGGVRRSDPKRSIILKSGDILLMSGEDRYRYHGVKRILPNTQPNNLIEGGGRINLTIRQVYEKGIWL